MLTQLTIGRRPVLGTFSKAIKGSASINFSQSGGDNCWRGCRHHPDPLESVEDPTRACYAVACERLYKNLSAQLQRHESEGAESVLERGIDELKRRKRVPWLRVSAMGSVPDKLTDRLVNGFRRLAQTVSPDRIHIPIESPDKARAYRDALPELCIRETAQTLDRFLSADCPVSYTAGSADQTRRERVDEAKSVAKARKDKSGRKAIACPAVASRFLQGKTNPKSKCGSCTACANPSIDVVYAFH
jgi:hypothetical protein